MKKPVQPVSYHDTEFRKFIINTHLNAQQKHDIDGIYFDETLNVFLTNVTYLKILFIFYNIVKIMN